jgi:hypothetical protein
VFSLVTEFPKQKDECVTRECAITADTWRPFILNGQRAAQQNPHRKHSCAPDTKGDSFFSGGVYCISLMVKRWKISYIHFDPDINDRDTLLYFTLL